MPVVRSCGSGQLIHISYNQSVDQIENVPVVRIGKERVDLARSVFI